MRKLSRLAPLVAVLLVVSAIGCAGTPPDRVALDTLKALKAGADAAMVVGNSLYVAGQLPEKTARQMVVDYDYFILAETTATTALGILATSQQVTQATVDAVMVAPTTAASKVTSAVPAGGK
jgi:hypothetical protein